jgi:hypothetical protein
MGWRGGCTGCWRGSLRERGHWGDPDVDGRIIKLDLQEVGRGRGDWMVLALVSTAKNFRVP